VKSIQQTPYSSLEVVRLGRFEWRVSSESESSELLGYIERQRTGRFEIVWMTDPMRWGYTATFDDALIAFADSARFGGEILAQRAEELATRQRARTEVSPREQLPRRSTWIESGGRSSVA
jgi:hypothetical protein